MASPSYRSTQLRVFGRQLRRQRVQGGRLGLLRGGRGLERARHAGERVDQPVAKALRCTEVLDVARVVGQLLTEGTKRRGLLGAGSREPGIDPIEHRIRSAELRKETGEEIVPLHVLFVRRAVARIGED